MSNVISLTQPNQWVFNVKQRIKVGICGAGVSLMFGRGIRSRQVVRVSDSKMSPTFNIGDYLIIDKSHSRERGSLDFGDGLYYVEYVGEVTQKEFERKVIVRIGRIPQNGVIRFDNEVWDASYFDINNIRILGKVERVVAIKDRRDII